MRFGRQAARAATRFAMQASRHMFRAALAGALALGAALPSQAQRDGEQRLVFVGADPAEGLPGPISGELGIVSFGALPGPDSVASDVQAALLRSTPVSTFLIGADTAAAGTGDLHLVVDLALTERAGTLSAVLGDETLPLDALEGRLTALVDALRPGARRIGYLRIHDPDDAFPRALDALRNLAQSLEFSIFVVTVGRSSGCEAGRTPHHFAVLAGVPDNAPFGSADGEVSRAEAISYLEEALRRDARRSAPCTVNYSLIFASDTPRGDTAPIATVPPVPLVAALNEAVHLESFAALFLLSVDDTDAIEDYLATCRYCPSEQALQMRLQEIGRQARALTLETEIWAEI